MTQEASHRAVLRDRYRQRRSHLEPAQRRRAETLIHTHIQALLQNRHLPTTGAYWGVKSEVRLQPWLERYKGNLALPRIVDEHQMNFHQWHPGDALVRGRFGISAPAANTPIVAPQELEVLLVPLVAYDRTGTRLGAGGGYYDRYLEHVNPRPLVVGIAFAAQEHEGLLPRDSWDVPLDAVATEDGMLEFTHADDH